MFGLLVRKTDTIHLKEARDSGLGSSWTWHYWHKGWSTGGIVNMC